MFDVELGLAEEGSQGGHNTVILRRDYQEFRVLHLALTNLWTSSNVRKWNAQGRWGRGTFLAPLSFNPHRPSHPIPHPST